MLGIQYLEKTFHDFLMSSYHYSSGKVDLHIRFEIFGEGPSEDWSRQCVVTAEFSIGSTMYIAAVTFSSLTRFKDRVQARPIDNTKERPLPGSPSTRIISLYTYIRISMCMWLESRLPALAKSIKHDVNAEAVWLKAIIFNTREIYGVEGPHLGKPYLRPTSQLRPSLNLSFTQVIIYLCLDT